MPDQQQVIIEFVADTTQLTPGVEQLEQIGALDQGTAVIFQKTNDALKARNALLAQTLAANQQLTASTTGQQDSYNKLVASVKNLSGASKDAVQSMLRFSTGDIAKSFKTVGATVDQYTTALEDSAVASNDATKGSVTLRTELRQLTQQLAQLTIAGETNSEEFATISARAGLVKNALKDTQQVVANLGSDVPTLQVFAAAASGITGAFTAAAGASALFGDDNKDLQEVLVKVNAVMAINQGLSQALNVVRDEAAISTARLLIAEQVNNAQIAINTGLQSENAIVTAAATVAQYAFNLALSLNPIGVVVVALAGFIAALEVYTSHAKIAAEATAALNGALTNTSTSIDAQVEGLKAANDEYLALLDTRNAKESEKQRAQAVNLKRIIQAQDDAIQQGQADLQAAQAAAIETGNKDIIAKAAELNTNIVNLQKARAQNLHDLDIANIKGQDQLAQESLAAAKANADARLALATKNSANFFAAQRVQAATEAAISLKAAGDNEEQANAVRAELHRKLIDINAAADAEAESQRQAAINANLNDETRLAEQINTKATSAETDLKILALQDQADYEVTLEGKTAQDIINIRSKLALDIQRLRQADTQRRITEEKTDANALLAVQLDNVKTGDAQRLQLAIQTARNEEAIQLAANNLSAQERLKIEADTDAKIVALRNAAIDKAAQDEIAINAANAAASNTELQRQLDAQSQIRSASTSTGGPKAEAASLGVPILNLDQQKAAIDEITQFQLKQNAILIDANAAKTQSQEDYAKTEAELEANAVKVYQDGEEKKRAATKATTDFQKAQTKAIISASLQGVSQGLQLLGQLYQQQDQAANDALAARKQNVQDELAAGQITAKAAAERNAELDAQQKKLQHDQAVRNKELAIFNAIVGTAQAVIAALDAPPPLSFIGAAIAGALGAAQIAIIASQPLPAFNTGKNNEYEGLGEVAEKGRPELLELGGKHYLAKQKSIVWLGKRDKVFTPDQTERMLAEMNTTIPIINGTKGGGQQINYDKIGKAVAENIPGISLQIDGYKSFIKEKHSFETRLNDRRKWGK